MSVLRRELHTEKNKNKCIWGEILEAFAIHFYELKKIPHTYFITIVNTDYHHKNLINLDQLTWSEIQL